MSTARFKQFPALQGGHTSGVAMYLLHRLAAQQLPIAVSGGEHVDAVRVLSLAGHIKASIPKPVRTLDGFE